MPSFKEAILADTPAQYLRVNESAGTNANDETVNNRDGTYGAGVTLAQSSLIPSDLIDTSILLSGTSTGRITTTYSPFVAGSTRTFLFIARRTASTEQDTIFGSDTSVGSAQVLFRLEAGAPATVKFYSQVGAPVEWASAWAGNNQDILGHLIYNDSTKKSILYLNAESKGEKTHGSAYSGTPGNLVIGAWANTFNNPWHGKLDDWAVFEGALSQARIEAQYQAFLSGVSEIYTVKGGFLRNKKGALITQAAGEAGEGWYTGFRRYGAFEKTGTKGQLAITESLTGKQWQGGFLRNAKGALIVKVSGEGLNWKSGFLRDKNGALAVTKSEEGATMQAGYLRNKKGELVIV